MGKRVIKNEIMNSVENYKKYVVPVCNDIMNGVGVFVGNFFVTAAHVVNIGHPVVWFDGKRYDLDKSKALIYKLLDNNTPNEECYDIAIYRFKDINSPFYFAHENLNPGDEVVCASMIHEVKMIKDGESVFGKETEEKYKFLLSNGKVDSLIANFMDCEMDYNFVEGSSGSPLFVGNKLVGVIRGQGYGGKKSLRLFQQISKISQNLWWLLDNSDN